MASKPTALIMAAGHGTRMRSELPKVLHPVCGRTMLAWVVKAAREGGAERVVCVIRPGQIAQEQLPDGVEVVEQAQGEGTAAAVLAARSEVENASALLILSGDHPLIDGQLLAGLAQAHTDAEAAATLLTTEGLDPAGYGRIVRDGDGTVERIVETKHTDGVPASELAIREINMGTYVFDGPELYAALDAVSEQDGELYLTGAFAILKSNGKTVAAHMTTDTDSAQGVNTRADLLEVERSARARLIEQHALNGVTFSAPDAVVIDATVEIGPGTTIESGVTLRGETKIGEGCTIGPATTIIDSAVGNEVTALHAYINEAEVANGATLGPFAYLRPGAKIGEGAKIGTFVEVKNSTVGARTKVPHLSYLGDADVGEDTNIGAGNVTANYDGRDKHRTKIGNRVKTGVDTTFVAPVTVGDDAYTGAGSVITEDVPDGALGISRPEQRSIQGYAKRKRAMQEADE